MTNVVEEELMATGKKTVDGKDYVLPAVVAVALQTNRPEVLRALADEAADKLRALSEDDKATMVRELFKLIADLMDNKKKLDARVEIYRDITSMLDGLKDEIEHTLDEVGDRLKDASA